MIVRGTKNRVTLFSLLKNRLYRKGTPRFPGEFARLFHGNNERVDQETLGLMTPLWEGAVRELLA